MGCTEPLDRRCAAPRGVERPWEWSEPAARPVGRDDRWALDDGRLLTEVLDRLTPERGPLEGSLLGRIFNPVHLDGARAWIEFTAGRRVVFEDRYAAESYFEFRALEHPRAVDLLYFLARWEADGNTVRSLTELAAEALHAHAELPFALGGTPTGRGPFAGLQDLKRVWSAHAGLEEVRARAGRRWPESFGELREWIVASLDHPLAPADEDHLLGRLRELARRRFPEPPSAREAVTPPP